MTSGKDPKYWKLTEKDLTLFYLILAQKETLGFSKLTCFNGALIQTLNMKPTDANSEGMGYLICIATEKRR